jgi:hypothetical protein
MPGGSSLGKKNSRPGVSRTKQKQKTKGERSNTMNET